METDTNIVPIQFSKAGRTWMPQPITDVFPTLPVGNYAVNKDAHGRFFLEEIGAFQLPRKIYGSNNQYSDRIIKTFVHRQKSTGVLLSGEKGSGKSLLAQQLSIEGAKLGFPTIVINIAWCGEIFNQFMQSIRQPTVVLFDEFEKVYDREHQEHVLTLLDGVYPSNKLYIFTANDKYKLDTHMRNRPGRIFYAIDYSGMEPAFVTEYCEDRLEDKEQIPTVLKVSMLFKDFNFDMLQALVEEMNRYKETALVAVRMLNIKPEFDSLSAFIPTIEVEGKNVVRIYQKTWKGNPLAQPIHIDYYYENPEKPLKKPKEDDDDYDNLLHDNAGYQASDMVEMIPEEGKFIFMNEKKEKLTLTREKIQRVEFYDHM